MNKVGETANNKVVGAWRLVSCEIRTSEGKVSYPLGAGPKGYIIYSADGYMSVAMCAAARKNYASGDILGGTTVEKTAAVDTYLSYCGTYKIQDRSVIHYVEVSLFPNWVGTDLVRFFEFDGNRLILSTPPALLGGVQQTSHLIWERA